MKKFYLFAIAALVCGTAAAEGRQQIASNLNLRQTNLKATEIQKNAKLSRKNVVKRAGEEGITKVEDFAGVWELSFFDLLEAADNTLELIIDVADADAGELVITGWPGGDFMVPATVNLETGIFSIPNNYFLGPDIVGDRCFFYLKSFDENYDLNDGATDAEASYGVIEGNSVVFPESDIWAIGDPANEEIGWWSLSFYNEIGVPSDPNEGWEDYGTATFEDGWVIPGLLMNPADNPWTVNVQKSIESEGMYRLVSPYIAEDSPLAFYGATEGYIVFNISDPDFVTVLPGIFGGFSNGSNKLYQFNIEGAYTSVGYSPEIIKEAFASEIENWSNYKNGVSTIYNCCFDYSQSCTSTYTWVDANGNSLADMMVSKISFDMDPVSVGTIGAPAQNTVEFFNLQGMPVKNPAPGQLLIKRTANGAVKTIIR